ncbi:MAG: vanadium-dependent haloperoxidase [Acidobacteriota bacterium]|nr:vanadium-dependent haloperoxidase [Acidobacteriota bacterium]
MTEARGPETPSQRRHDALRRRKEAAHFYAGLGSPAQRSNGDEDDPKLKKLLYAANYSKGLPHDPKTGLVDPKAYETLLHALSTGEPEDFEKIRLNQPPSEHCASSATPSDLVRTLSNEVKAQGDQMKLVDPQSGLAFDTGGLDGHQLTLKPAYKFTSAEEIGEIAENYWMALCRDVPFSEYDSQTPPPNLGKAADDLSKFSIRDFPKKGGKVTPATVFRGFTEGDLVGPYLSQFLVMDIPYGSQVVPPTVAIGLPDQQDYMTDQDSWLNVQNGTMPSQPKIALLPANDRKRIWNARGLCQYVHIDELFQAYLNACLLLITPRGTGDAPRGGLEAALSEGNPYVKGRCSTQMGFGTLGEPNFKVLVAEVATRALKTVWYQKWFIHRRLRPEVFAGRIHFDKTGQLAFPFHQEEYKKLDDVLKLIKDKGKTYLLPMAFPEGSPLHPSYGAGHATVAGACVTVLKALFKDDQKWSDLPGAPVPQVPLPDGHSTRDYKGDWKEMTVGGELDKLAGNIGLARNFAGVHWRSDYAESLKLGEKIALYFLQETIRTYNEDVFFSLHRFDGRQVRIDQDTLQTF